jgi:Rps23 Pro-64 3,4-dihydroxylase Tpa1-like proline 4-hydroxylase
VFLHGSKRLDRSSIADLIAARIERELPDLRKNWQQSGPIHHVVIDDLLPVDLANRIYAAFPEGRLMGVRRSLRELKYIAAQMDGYDPLLEETVFAFQDLRVVDAFAHITNIHCVEPDEHLYAGGISMMEKGHFLNPHIDNSHDKERKRYRVLNLLYYVSPDWKSENGGNLEVWPGGISAAQTTIVSRFNRLVAMITNTTSWHSVSPVAAAERRCCVSNYYFSEFPADKQDYYHVTSYRGRPQQKMRDLVLRADNAVKTVIMKTPLRHLINNTHFYAKKK